MPAKHLLSIGDLESETILSLVDNVGAIAEGRWPTRSSLAGRIVGIYFCRTSTRTRTSFTVGAMKLGAPSHQLWAQRPAIGDR